MNNYDFSLRFSLQNSSDEPSNYIEKLHEVGCDDALIGVGRIGYIVLDFTREAPSAYTAISSAIIEIKSAIPNAILMEAMPDFVGLTDVAKLLGCTRQNIRNLMVKCESKSPLPVYEGTPSIWHLAEVLTWLKTEKSQPIDDLLLEVAKTNMNLNIARQWQKVGSTNLDEIKQLVA
jgi:hypothetical protein